MANDWIKMRCNLWTHPKVALMAARLQTKKATVVGALHGVWTLADQHADGGYLAGLNPDMVDASTDVPGFADAMKAAGWISFDEGGAHFPAYEEHNGSTGKGRAMANRRQKGRRHASVTQVSRSCHADVTPDRDTTVTRGEENRGDKKRVEKKEKKNEDIAPSGEDAASVPSDSVLTFQTKGKPRIWHLTQARLDEYAALYPGVDVLFEMRKARQWCEDAPAKRKTAHGMPRFCTRWLNRANDRPGRPEYAPPPTPDQPPPLSRETLAGFLQDDDDQ